MGFLVRNGTDEDTPLLGLQSGTRVPQISEISVDREGVALKVREAHARAATHPAGTAPKLLLPHLHAVGVPRLHTVTLTDVPHRCCTLCWLCVYVSVRAQGGDAITFSWQFVAAGEEKCYHDGVEILSTPCASPMIVVAKAFR